MGQQMKLKFNHKGFEDILCSGELGQYMAFVADKIADSANANNTRGGQGFEADIKLGSYGRGVCSKRLIGLVHTTDYKSRVAEAEDKALSRAVH